MEIETDQQSCNALVGQQSDQGQGISTPDENINTDDENIISQRQTVGMNEHDEDEHDVVLENESMQQCDECHEGVCKHRGYRWMKCTVCTNFNLCEKCWLRHGHPEHAGDTHWYKWHGIINPKPFHSCNCCGFTYHPDNPYFTVWKCDLCENYSLCKRCNEDNMHVHHEEYVDERLLIHLK